MRIAIQAEPFDPAHEMAAFGKTAHTGAIVTFTGLVRDDSGTIETLEIEHYPGMTEAVVTEYAHEAVTRFDLSDVLVIHRFGAFQVGDPIMMVATAARHRKAAFEAAEYLMDWLKSRAPFWKKEIGAKGGHWVAAKADDEALLKRW